MIVKYILFCIFIAWVVYVHLKDKEEDRISLMNIPEEEIEHCKVVYKNEMDYTTKFENLSPKAQKYCRWKDSHSISPVYDCAIITIAITNCLYIGYIVYENNTVYAGDFVTSLFLSLLCTSILGGMTGGAVSSLALDRFIKRFGKKNVKYWTTCLLCSLLASLLVLGTLYLYSIGYLYNEE